MIRHAVRITDATSEPLTLAEAKAWLRVDSDDDGTEIEALIKTARQYVENYTGLAILPQTWRFVASEWPEEPQYVPNAIRLPRAPLATVTSVKYYPEGGGAQATFSSANYHVVTVVEPGLVVLAEDKSWPDLAVRPDAVEINYTAGYATTAAAPQAAIHAVKLVLAHFYENRSPVNIGNIVTPMPLSLTDLLNSLRVEGWCA